MNKIDYEYGYSGEIIVLLDGVRVATVDNWEEYREARNELLDPGLDVDELSAIITIIK